MRYNVDRVKVLPKEERRAQLKFRDTVRPGTEYVYSVIDENYRQPYRWDFLVRVPDAGDQSIEVRPAVVPNVKAWAGLERRALMFQRATLGGHRGQWYCKVALADVSGARTRMEASSEQRADLPYWFRGLLPRMRTKESVRRTRGTDRNALVITVPPGDHALMIRIFLAAKAWVLKEKFQL